MIRELHQKLVSKEISAVQLTQDYFDVIEKRDGEIGAYLTLTKELAFEQARMVDERISNNQKIGMLEGIPGAIKDMICVEGVRTTAGSRILDNYIAPYDATVIKKIKETRAVILGKTNQDEFAMGSSNESSFYQKTKNPTDISRVPGGSSGGSAAAVAAEEAVWSLGTDTGGSIRQPASFCGVVGLKPTYGRVSRYGAIAMASSLDQIGPFAKTVEDVAIVLSVLAGEDPMDATSAKSGDKKYEDFLTGDIAGKVIGIPKEYVENLEGEIKEIFEKSVEKFKALGVKIEEISLPNSQYALPVYYIIMTSEVSSNLAKFDGIKFGMRADDLFDSNVAENELPKNLLETYLDTRKIGFGDEVKRRIMLGTYSLSAGYYDAYYLKAQKVRALIKRDFEQAYEKVDFVYCPTCPEVAFKFGEKTADPLKMYLSDIFTISVNLAGVPAISFPIGSCEIEGKGLPVGGQLIGKWFDEEGILNAAHTFEINKDRN
ncbi:MAG: Asp-tRNA(Asn)/Glu-tRNA(Gln) amidotransferase subunit GatA [Candidatus Moranbacteria bacterium]|nr:Asp-tRNA(Asn)/Glu-tRNA(Gln) amidotransferase subunit GatA [Candidatus Moranbacteria bacterium]